MSATNELRDVIGQDGLLTLSRRFGGKTLYVPEQPTPGHFLQGALGQDRFQLLVRHFGRDYVYVPTGPARRERDKRMAAMLATGANARQIARELGVSPRTVRHNTRFERLDQQLQTQRGPRWTKTAAT